MKAPEEEARQAKEKRRRREKDKPNANYITNARIGAREGRREKMTAGVHVFN